METLQAFPASYPDDLRLNAQQLPPPCPGKHVSTFPGYGRELCPLCGKIYVRKVA